MKGATGEPIGPPPDPRAAGISTIDYCKLLPKRRGAHDAKGKLLFFPRTGMVMVPCVSHRWRWSCVVVVGNQAGTYTPSGYSLDIGDEEIETAIEIDIKHSVLRAVQENLGLYVADEQLPLLVFCPGCDGIGLVDDDAEWCQKCNGVGAVVPEVKA